MLMHIEVRDYVFNTLGSRELGSLEAIKILRCFEMKRRKKEGWKERDHG